MSYIPVKTDKRIKHGKCRSPEYAAWRDIKNRCTNPNIKDFDNYGGRGIKICSEWEESFDAFFKDMGMRPSPNMSIDRIDNDGGYTPNNCRWSDDFRQNANREIMTNNTSGFTGVSWSKSNNGWCVLLCSHGIQHYLGTHETVELGAEARDKFIIGNNLPHKLSNLHRTLK